jgi:hypothetical protein
MTRTIKVSKLIDLRSKTDRELLALIGRELSRALALARVAANTKSPFYEKAENISETMATLLPTIAGVEGAEREALESSLKEVRLALASVPAQQVRSYACSLAAN